MRRRTATGLAVGLLSPLLLVMAALPAQAGPVAPANLTSPSLQAPTLALGNVLRAAEKDPAPKSSTKSDKDKGSDKNKVKLYTPNDFDLKAAPAPLTNQKIAPPTTTGLDKPPADFPKSWPAVSGQKSADAGQKNNFTTYFGGKFESVTFEPGVIRVKGWAYASTSPGTSIQVLARTETGAQYSGVANGYRPEVGFGGYHGFNFTIPLPAAKGPHTVCMYGYANYTTGLLSCINYNSRPFGAIDQYIDSVVVPSGRYSVFRGWVIDPYTAAPAQFDVVRDGVKVLTIPAPNNHPGAAQAYPTFGTNHGFEVWMKHELSNGNHTICMYGSASAQETLLGCRDHDEQHDVQGYLDQVAWQGENVLVRGWAIDFDSTDAVSVSISAGGKLIKTVPANVSRPDLIPHFPQYGALHGFETTIPGVLNEQEVTITAKNIGSAAGADKTWKQTYDGSSGPCRCVRENFEAGSLDKSLYFRAQGQLTSDPARRVTGNFSPYGEAPASQPWNEFLWSDPAKLKLAPLTSYTVTFKYRLLAADGTKMHPYVLARTPSGGITKDTGFTMWEEVSDGDVKSKSVTFTTNAFGDYYLIWGLNNGGAMAVDDIVLSGPLNRG